jgi:hypothetical protein
LEQEAVLAQPAAQLRLAAYQQQAVVQVLEIPELAERHQGKI